jgi:hypothetical protein
MINLVDYEIHTLAALLDYCTIEGGLEGYPRMEDHLLHHMFEHQRVKPFYQDYNLSKTGHPIDPATHIKAVSLDNSAADLRWSKCIDNRGLTTVPEAANTFGTRAQDHFGKILLQLIHNNIVEDIGYAQLETTTLTLVDVLKHQTEYPDKWIDITWYWDNPDAIIDAIWECGLTPNDKKVKEFCTLVANLNSRYYNTVQHSYKVYRAVVEQVGLPIELTCYETAIVHALLIMQHQPAKVKLIHSIPTNTEEFIKFYT